MNTKTETAPDGRLDVFKWAIAIILLSVGIVGFYYFAEQSQLLRTVGLLILGGLAVFIASTTLKGQQSLRFVKEAHIEVRKVVWPTRKETIQTTGIVLLMVLLVAVFIWLLDSLLLWIVRILTGQGS